MKHTALSLIIAAASLAGCSDIDTDDRYILTEGVAAKRSVLIEDFTGQKCINCPKAHSTMHKLVEQYGDAVIPVSIHAGSFGVPVDYDFYTGLMQPDGNQYNDMWGITEWPKGVVNRTGGPTNHDEWPQLVRDLIAKKAPLEIEVEATAGAEATAMDIKVTLSAPADLGGKLQVWVLEDGIVARQDDEDLGTIRDYVHDHVYRATVNGFGGEAVSLQGGIHSSFDYTVAFRDTEYEKWVPENLSVVAFVYDNSGVLQAAKAKLEIAE